MKDYYDILQVNPTAEPEVIDAAYGRLLRRYHPDVYTGGDATERLRELNEAHAVLSDPVKRALYDRVRYYGTGEGRRPEPEAPGPAPEAQQPEPRETAKAPEVRPTQRRPILIGVGLLGLTSGATSRLEAAAWPRRSLFSVVVLPTYTAAIITAEMVTVLVDARWGVGLHVAVLWALLVHFSWAKERSEAKLLLALCLAPLIRILSLGMPLGDVDLVYWFLIVGAPMIVAALLAARTLGLSRHDLGLTVRSIPVQLLIGATGLGLGVAEYLILKPEALIDELTWQQAWWPALILLVATGFGEELIFRGVMQSASTDALGKAAIVYVAIVFAALHVGYKSAPDVAFVFFVALFFGWAVARTGSLLGVTLSHGISNVLLYIVVPFTVIAVD